MATAYPAEAYERRSFAPTAIKRPGPYRIVPLSQGQSWEIGPMGRALQPRALLFIRFSRVYFDAGFTEAFCYQHVGCLHWTQASKCVIESCADVCGGDFLIRASKQQGRWVLVSRTSLCNDTRI
jgi:hypothetical protein